MTRNRKGERRRLEMVAAAAGVSRSTVSRVDQRLAEGRARGARRGRTRPSKSSATCPTGPPASSPAGAPSRSPCVIPENTAKFFADPYFATVVQGMAMYLSDTDYTLSLLIAAEKDGEKTRRYLQAGNVDGALILSHHCDDRSYVAAGALDPGCVRRASDEPGGPVGVLHRRRQRRGRRYAERDG